ncbi:MAG TPA: 5'-nucleotidase C-terminal domain-containing protein [Chitinophagaceae bacterium]
MKFHFRPYWLLLLLLLSCKASFLPVKAEYVDYRITSELRRDTTMLLLIDPYKDSVNNSMNKVIGRAVMSLDKKKPEGTLGNFMADAMLHSARAKFNLPVDLAFVNYGGIRITQLPAGDVTIGKVFELMPFDNLLIVQEVKGSDLQQFLDLTAASGGWPVSEGISMQIKDKKAVNVEVNGKPLDPGQTYLIANSDYVINGGDNVTMFKNLPQKNMGYLMRDAIIDYIAYLKAQGKDISAKLENRVTNAQ